jgi:Rieske Fe-S protein
MNTASDAHDPTRRRVVQGALAVGAAAAAVGPLAACAGESADTSGVVAPTGSEGAAGPIVAASEVPVNGGRVVTAADRKVVVTQPEEGTFKAFTAVCTHAGCTVNNVESDVITCLCHGSQFDASTGAVVRGPATTPLAGIPIAVEGGEITFA